MNFFPFRPMFFYAPENGGAGSGSPEPAVTDPPTSQTPATDPAKGTGDDVDTWKKRAVGWQRAHDALKADLDGKTEKFTALSGELEGLKKQVEESNKKLQSFGDMELKLTEATAERDRIKLVSTKYPELLPLLADDLLPAGSGEAWEAKLAKLSQSFKKPEVIEPPAPAQKKDDIFPEPPQKKESLDEKDIMRQANEALRKGDDAEYNRLLDVLFQTQKK